LSPKVKFFAFKCSYAEVDGKAVDVQKRPMELDANGNITLSLKNQKQAG
jgi:nicotinamide phosphoribosyltransferase